MVTYYKVKTVKIDKIFNSITDALSLFNDYKIGIKDHYKHLYVKTENNEEVLIKGMFFNEEFGVIKVV